MTYLEAMQELTRGKHMRLPHWNDESYVYVQWTGRNNASIINLGGRRLPFEPKPDDLVSDQWQVLRGDEVKG